MPVPWESYQDFRPSLYIYHCHLLFQYGEVLINVKCQRLVGNVFQRVKQDPGGDTNLTGIFRVNI